MIKATKDIKNNLIKNIPYYDLLIRQINGPADEPLFEPWICEKAVLFADFGDSIVTKICEGYQFTIAFLGNILNGNELKKELSSFGYHFLTDKNAELALAQLKKLKGLHAHSSVLLSSVDEKIFKRLGIQLTCEAKYESENKIYHK